MIALILAFGKPILWLFGPDFQAGYPLMFILAIALIARAAVGPAERVLNMLGEQRRCALVYAAVFALNLAGCFAVAGPYGSIGVAIVIAATCVVEFGAAVPGRQAPARPAHADLAAERPSARSDPSQHPHLADDRPGRRASLDAALELAERHRRHRRQPAAQRRRRDVVAEPISMSHHSRL